MNCYRGHIPIREPCSGSKELPSKSSLDHALEEVDALAALFQGDNGLLAGSGVTAVQALAAPTAPHVDGVDLLDLHAEQLLDRVGDLDLARVGGHFVGVLLVGNAHHRV